MNANIEIIRDELDRKMPASRMKQFRQLIPLIEEAKAKGINAIIISVILIINS